MTGIYEKLHKNDFNLSDAYESQLLGKKRFRLIRLILSILEAKNGGHVKKSCEKVSDMSDGDKISDLFKRFKVSRMFVYRAIQVKLCLQSQTVFPTRTWSPLGPRSPPPGMRLPSLTSSRLPRGSGAGWTTSSRHSGGLTVSLGMYFHHFKQPCHNTWGSGCS